MLIPLLVSSLLTQTPSEPSQDAATRAAQAAERAAAAAEKAAAAAQTAATTAAQLAAQVPSLPAPVTPAPAVAAAATAEKPPAQWTSTVGLGLISLTGNAESLVFNGTAQAERKTEQWIFGARAYAAYGQTRPPDGSAAQVVALNGGLQLREDLRFSPMTSAFVLGGVETDHVKSVELRTFVEVGSGIIWLDVREGDLSKLFLRTDLALRYLNERRYQYFPTPMALPESTLVAPRLGVSFRYSLSKDVSFHEDAEVLTNVAGAPRTLVGSTTKISARLVRSLLMAVSFQVTHDSSPAAGKKPTDTALTASVEMAL